jgi:hypothetical protein
MSCPFLLNYEIASLGELKKTTQNREVVNFRTKIHAFSFPDTKSGIVEGSSGVPFAVNYVYVSFIDTEFELWLRGESQDDMCQ